MTTCRRLAALIVAVTLAILAGEAGLTAQNPRRDGTREPEPIATSPNAPARTVRIDAVVTDRKGAPIRNLRADDFEVVENGVVQRIEAVEPRGGSSRPGETAPPFPIASDEDEVRAARQPGTRVIAMLLDEFHVSPGEPTARVRAAMRQFMDELVRPSDLLLVLKPLESVTELRFTRDHQAARGRREPPPGRIRGTVARTRCAPRNPPCAPGSRR